jgi:NAD(P) transhydrogenase subunit alpha
MINVEMVTIFILACFVGYYVVLKVTPALHAPLMSVTNAISSVIIVIALDAVLVGICSAEHGNGVSVWFGGGAVLLAAVNIIGGFMLTRRMLSMFADKKKQVTEKRS